MLVVRTTKQTMIMESFCKGREENKIKNMPLGIKVKMNKFCNQH